MAAGAGPDCINSAALITSELVTNAVRHGSWPVTFGVDVRGEIVRVEVGDDDSGDQRSPMPTRMMRAAAG